LAKLTNLKVLWLEGNQLTSVPKELGQLTNLKELRLDGNKLTGIPKELGRLTNLERLTLEGNPLELPPPEVVKQGMMAVLAYLRELEKGEKERYEAKLLILGDGSEGKTCVSRALRGLPFKKNIRT
jgi:internalin A